MSRGEEAVGRKSGVKDDKRRNHSRDSKNILMGGNNYLVFYHIVVITA